MYKLTFAILTAALFIATPSHAGSQYQSAYCHRNSDGSGTCYGTFLGFRNSSDPGAWVEFLTNSGGGSSFDAGVNAAQGYCSVPPGSALVAMWPQAMASRGYFNISWSAAGICTGLSLANSSIYSNY